MVTNYYTLCSLAEAWDSDIPGCIVGDVYSQSKDELTIALASSEKTWMIRISTNPKFRFAFRSEGYNKAKRNVAALFPDTLDKHVAAVRIADGDRILFIDFQDGSCFQVVLFGPKANVFYVSEAGAILDAFQHRESLRGQPAPASVPAPLIDSLDSFQARWRTDRKTTARAIATAFPFFNADLANEVAKRTGNLPETPSKCTEEDLAKILDAARSLTKELCSPEPRIYWHGQRAVLFSLAHLDQPDHIREEIFEDIDKAVTVYIRRRLGQQAFDAVYTPLEKALRTAKNSYAKRLETMLSSLSEESRADKYERWGHLLMAAQADVPPKADSVELADLFEENRLIVIPLDPAKSAVENAQRYYGKARKTRQARQHAEERLEKTESQALEATALYEQLLTLTTRSEVLKFEKAEARRLVHFLGRQASSQPQIPFRRFELNGGYEVWVGKNAKQNEALTFRYARKFDFWLHARGVPGSHTLLRRPGKSAQPGKNILETAAGIAAYYSKARGSHLVPVIVTERKYVRKPKGVPSGTVIVEKEQVLLVEPALP